MKAVQSSSSAVSLSLFKLRKGTVGRDRGVICRERMVEIYQDRSGTLGDDSVIEKIS